MHLLLWYFADISLKKASKLFAQKFSCGSSVSGDDEIIIQGDVTDDLIDLILETWNEVFSFFLFTYSADEYDSYQIF